MRQIKFRAQDIAFCISAERVPQVIIYEDEVHQTKPLASSHAM